jgi:hypothetical protein
VTIRDRLQELQPERDELSLYRTRELVPAHRMAEQQARSVGVINHPLDGAIDKVYWSWIWATASVSWAVRPASLPSFEKYGTSPNIAKRHSKLSISIDPFVARPQLRLLVERRRVEVQAVSDLVPNGGDVVGTHGLDQRRR